MDEIYDMLYPGKAPDKRMDADEERYKDALRGYMRAGRDASLVIRRGAA